MSKTQTQPQEMSREELVQRVEELERRIDGVELENIASADTINIYFAQLAEGIGADVDDYTADAMQHIQAIQGEFEALQEVVREQQKVINDLEDPETRTPDEAWLNVIEMARNKVSGSRKVKLDCDELQKATGYSSRHCSNKIEDWGQEKHGATWEPYKPPSESRQGSAKKKKLVIDLTEWDE
jgi:hypothetical protein